ncbi:hypothetical protein NQ176_g6891 [Zarea fungicola]|uniref:Uncharacterized protein n=1 Tax=Zarea fungicola TaxID=93591 RepID=A0ACC1N382_9HYPO|nr:hypothetical protein NQ176_g6891 [Lecanicillium fungicola]
MDKFDNCVLLTRVGGFYELYFEQAEEYAPLLNIKLASKKTSAGPVPMAGFPFFQLDRYLKVLVQDLNRYVAIAEEFPNNAEEKIKSGGLLHDRRVARIITTGTLIDENFLDPYENAYVMAVHVSSVFKSVGSSQTSAFEPSSDDTSIGLAWLDLSTGNFFTQATTLGALSSVLSRICPKEIVLDQDFEAQKEHVVFSILADDHRLITYAPVGELTDISDWSGILASELPEAARETFTNPEIQAGSLLLSYVEDRLQGLCLKLQPPQRYENLQNMTIDKNSLRALEVRQTIRGDFFRGSLLHAIRRTVTKSGSRLLNEWLSAPSTSAQIIASRQDLVARFIEAPDLRDLIITLLRRSHDSQRLVQKFALGRGDADDLIGLASTVQATADIVNLLEQSSFSDSESECLLALTKRIDLRDPLILARRISEAIDEDGIFLQQEVADSEASQMMALAEGILAAEGSPEDASLLRKGKKKRPTSIKEYYAEDNETGSPSATFCVSALAHQV